MSIKSSTFITAAMHALFPSTPKTRLAGLAIMAGFVATLVLWRIHVAAPALAATSTLSAEKAGTGKSAGMKWSYDELAHKLIIQNTDLAYNDLGKDFSQGIGKSLSKVARHIDGKPVIANL